MWRAVPWAPTTLTHIPRCDIRCDSNAAAAADAITALQGVAAEDREKFQTALMELDQRLTGRVNEVQTSLAAQVLQSTDELSNSVEVSAMLMCACQWLGVHRNVVSTGSPSHDCRPQCGASQAPPPARRFCRRSFCVDAGHTAAGDARTPRRGCEVGGVSGGGALHARGRTGRGAARADECDNAAGG